MALEVLQDFFHCMPFGQEFNLSNGKRATIKSFIPPELSDEGKAFFAFDVKLVDGSGHWEFTVTQTGWEGAVTSG